MIKNSVTALDAAKTEPVRTASLRFFSTLTKGINFRYSPKDAAILIKSLAEDLDFVELTADETISAINAASSHGVRGARVHDLMHAVAAEKYKAAVIFTLDEAGFSTLKNSIPAKAP